MRLLGRLLLYVLLALGLAKMVLYLVFAAAMLPLPLENHDLEAKMVLLAYRAEAGLSLYPAWWNYPYVCNWYGPINPLLVGALGRLFGAGIPGLFLIGRAVSLLASIATSLVLAAALGRRYGGGAGLAAGVLSLGSAPMFGFTATVRPDALAELFGVGGFLLSESRSRSGFWAAIALLILAVLTKQTAVVFIVAAALAAALSGQWRRGVFILVATGAGLIVIVAAVNLFFEPYFARSLVGDRSTPWRFTTWHLTLRRSVRSSPQLLLLPVVGLWLWIRPGDRSRPRDVRPAILALLLLAAALGLSAKVGADINYYLSLRVATALAVAALWHAVHADAGATAPERPFRRSAALAMASLLAIAAVVPALQNAVANAEVSNIEAAFYQTPKGHLFLRTYRDAIALARNPRVHVLTDSGLIDLYQGERAAFGDPFLFRTLVEADLLRPTAMAQRIDSQYYDVFISTHDLDSPDYARHDFRLPTGLFERVRANYVRDQSPPGLQIYKRRGRREAMASQCSPSPREGCSSRGRLRVGTGQERRP
jgi:hypothetical protein